MNEARNPPSPVDVANTIVRARKERRTVPAAEVAAGLRDADDAYEVQRLAAELMPQLRTGTPPTWKSGGPSRDTPLTHAALPTPGVMASPADASALHFNHRWIEAEVALRLGADGNPEAMAVSIEIVDTRWDEGRGAPALLKLADLQSHGALVLGAWIPYVAKDWSKQHCEVRIGASVREFTGTHSLGDPAWLLPQWKAHVASQGGVLPAGSVVTTGTWCGVLQAEKGDLVQVAFDGIGNASVQF